MVKNSMDDSSAIVVKDLRKAFKDNQVLKGVNFTVKKGTVLALLGPNGAGKTTTIKIMSTLLQPDGGQAFVNGHDVVADADGARASIGLTGQYAAVDEYLTGEENLKMLGRLYHLSKSDTNQRTEELLKQVGLVKSSKRAVKTYSGGMKRRLDLAMSLIAKPPIIFLDEPTTGLDPRSRMSMWTMIKNLVEDGITILLTTQYMEEADHLADNIIVLDHGKIIAEGTASQLKSKVGSDYLDVELSDITQLEDAKKVLSREKLQINKEQGIMSIATKGGVAKLKKVLQQLEDAKINVENVNLRRPTLDDVFLSLTGHGATDKKSSSKKKSKKSGGKK